MKIENALQEVDFYGSGIPFQEGWTLSDVKKLTRHKCDCWLDNVYDYDFINSQTKWILMGKPGYEGLDEKQIPDLDPFLWEEFS